MNPNDIRIRRVYTRTTAAPDVVDNSADAGNATNYELIVEWEAGGTANAMTPTLHLSVTTRDITANALVTNLTFIDTAVTTNGVNANTKYEYSKNFAAGDLTDDHMYEVSAALIHPTVPMHSYEHSWVFCAY